MRVAVTGVAACVHRVPELERALTKRFDAGALAGWDPDFKSFLGDMHASAGYRAQLLKVGAREAVRELTGGSHR